MLQVVYPATACVPSVPGKGGMYLILQGSVERISRDLASKKISSTVVSSGNNKKK